MALKLPFLLLLRRCRYNWTMNNGEHSIFQFIHNQQEQFVSLYVLGLYHLHRKWSLLSIIDNIIANSMDFGLTIKRNRPTRIAKSYWVSLWTNWRFFVSSKIKQPQLWVFLRHIKDFVWNWKLKEFTLYTERAFDWEFRRTSWTCFLDYTITLQLFLHFTSSLNRAYNCSCSGRIMEQMDLSKRTFVIRLI